MTLTFNMWAQDFKIGDLTYRPMTVDPPTAWIMPGNGCSEGIETVTIDKVTYNGLEYTITGISMRVFQDCPTLKHATIGNSVEMVGSELFRNCTRLESVTIGRSVPSIGNYAFQGCTNLTTVECYNLTPPHIDATTFKDVDLKKCTLYVPASAVDTYKNSDSYWCSFSSIEAIPGTSINSPSYSEMKVYSSGSNIVVKDAVLEETISIYAISGQLVKQTIVASNETIIALPKGMYILKVGKANFKVINCK